MFLERVAKKKGAQSIYILLFKVCINELYPKGKIIQESSHDVGGNFELLEVGERNCKSTSNVYLVVLRGQIDFKSTSNSIKRHPNCGDLTG